LNGIWKWIIQQSFAEFRLNNGVPAKITIDKSGSNKAAIEEYISENKTEIETLQIKYLNNIVEQDHRSIKLVVRPMLGFKAFHSASVTINGTELVRMIRKGQFKKQNNLCQTPVEIFYSLAA
jgi:transposase-like protein